MIHDLAFHLTISADSETVRLFFSTIAFVAMCWIVCKLFKKSNRNEGE